MTSSSPATPLFCLKYFPWRGSNSVYFFNLLYFQPEGFFSSQPLSLFMQTLDVYEPELPFERRILDFEQERMGSECDFGDLLWALWDLFENVFRSASLESVVQLLNRLDDIGEVVEYFVHNQLVRYAKSYGIRSHVDGLLFGQLNPLLLAKEPVVQTNVLGADDPAPRRLDVRRCGVHSRKLRTSEWRRPPMAAGLYGEDLYH
jgi:hypothetical protein